MPDILTLTTPDWELNVWCKDICCRAAQLEKTLDQRGKTGRPSLLRFSKPLVISQLRSAFSYIPPENCAGTVAVRQQPLTAPLFFENTLYEFEFTFQVPVTDREPDQPAIRHKLNSINDAFHFTNRHGIASLRGSINTGNDIGWLRLPLRYHQQGKTTDIALSFEVLPVKMDLGSDLGSMYGVIDRSYPLWRFALAEKTDHEAGQDRSRRTNFPLLWLAQFESLRAELEQGIKQILNAPHSRLMPADRSVRADRLKGSLSVRLIEKVREDLATGNYAKRYRTNQKKLCTDTPENRFIKMVLCTTHTKLSHFSRIARKKHNSPDKQRLSEAFFEQLRNWQQPLGKYSAHPLFKEIGDFSGLNGESLVLQQKNGYATVYRVWQQLKFYLDVLGNQTSVSMKSVAELYEVWCFLEIRRILTEELGFTCKQTRKAQLRRQNLELKLNDGFGGAFNFSRDDGIKIKLAHEPVFRKNGDVFRVWTATQQPDILLEATFNSGEQFIWLFDAKYRIKADSDETNSSADHVPDDALNQMHRYRDALIHLNNKNSPTEKSRPVFGAYALYPGYYCQHEDNSHLNPYTEAIREIGIGAFPLLPSADNSTGSRWLTEFLTERFGLPAKPYSIAKPDRHYIEESARIPYLGMKQTRYPDLTLVMPSASKKGMNADYVRRFETGAARWYHVPVTTIAGRYGNHIMRELRHCAIATIAPGEEHRTLKWIWQITSVRQVKRSELDIKQAGSLKNSDELYWLIELGAAFQLPQPVTGINRRHFKQAMKLTTAARLAVGGAFKHIQDIYPEFSVLTA